MLDFPPAPKLDPVTGRLDRTKGSASESRGEEVFFRKGKCGSCHAAPLYLGHQSHDLHVERFLKDEPSDGTIKTFTLRGIKDSPAYLHHGRLLT
jgi:cytochrome c peroxidase